MGKENTRDTNALGDLPCLGSGIAHHKKLQFSA